MKASEIKVGERYYAKVSGKSVIVRVDQIVRPSCRAPTYLVTNTVTERKMEWYDTKRFIASVIKHDDPHESPIGQAMTDLGATPITLPDPGCPDRCSEAEAPSKDNPEGTPCPCCGGIPTTLPNPSDPIATRAQRQKQNGNAPHLIVLARAGTGKTTTLVEGLKKIKNQPVDIEPSPQQAAIWRAMERSAGVGTVCFVAFNKAIATELEQRVPSGCDAMTMHSMGFRAVRDRFGLVKLNNFRVQDIISEILEVDIRELRRKKPDVLRATERLVGLCKVNLIDPTGFFRVGDDNNSLQELASRYDIDLNGCQTEVIDLVPKVLERCKDVDQDRCLDFNDMIWLPVVLGLSVFKYDLLLVDEAQDLNRCQQELAMMAGDRLIMCGDDKQTIYGFAGADSESMERMHRRLHDTKRGCVVLPLTVTRRCGRAIVAEAQKYVPDFEAHESCGEGKISNAKIAATVRVHEGCATSSKDTDKVVYRSLVQDGDMILCRCNAPLVSECFRFLREGRKAVIRGRDVGQGLIILIKKLDNQESPLTTTPQYTRVALLITALSDWLHSESLKEQAKRNPNEAKLIALQDKHDCILAFCEGVTTVEAVRMKIESVFTDDKNGQGITLSSIHKAKGLEADRVFLLQPANAPIPHPMATTVSAQEQEYNLLYVAITRAKNELVYVS